MNYTKEDEISIANRLKEKYKCDIIFNEDIPYTLYCAQDIGIILEYSNINKIIKCENKYQIKSKTNNGYHNKSYMTLTLLLKLLNKSRKESSLDICNIIDINIHSNKFICIETDTIKSIMDTFCGEKMIKQFRIKKYYIDLYFEEYRLAIECDEKHDNIIYDSKRENEIIDELDCVFIRYKPFDKDFNIFKILNKIYLHINKFKK
jgi:very-short-patch-repair endonuclease